MAIEFIERRLALVNLGLVVEGDSEKSFIESKYFNDFAASLNIHICSPVINAKGGGNLISRNIDEHIRNCRKFTKPDRIFVLTDLEHEPCIEAVKQRIGIENADAIIVSRKAIEAWFIADYVVMSKWLKEDFYHENPEIIEEKPYEFLKSYTTAKNKRGPGSHVLFAKKMITLGFSLERAAQHLQCTSAQYFIKKLREISQSELTIQ